MNPIVYVLFLLLQAFIFLCNEKFEALKNTIYLTYNVLGERFIDIEDNGNASSFSYGEKL